MQVHLYVDFFQYVHTTVVYDPQLVESMVVEMWIWRAEKHLDCFYFGAAVNHASMNII